MLYTLTINERLASSTLLLLMRNNLLLLLFETIDGMAVDGIT